MQTDSEEDDDRFGIIVFVITYRFGIHGQRDRHFRNKIQTHQEDAQKKTTDSEYQLFSSNYRVNFFRFCVILFLICRQLCNFVDKSAGYCVNFLRQVRYCVSFFRFSVIFYHSCVNFIFSKAHARVNFFRICVLLFYFCVIFSETGRQVLPFLRQL